MNSSSIASKINQYNSSLNKVGVVRNNLVSAIEVLSNIIDTQNSCYKLDDGSASGSYLNDLLEKEKGILSNIDSNVVPAINRAIENLRYQYQAALQREAAEREASLNG
ncbi:MAG: hypothetical protein IKH54_00725 [Bacilli bacterium]|nr:hypothetical protein [Bacilli bacterium]